MRIADTASSANASAISATTSARDSLRAYAPAEARTPSVSTAFGAVRVACQSGARLDEQARGERHGERKRDHRPVDRDPSACGMILRTPR